MHADYLFVAAHIPYTKKPSFLIYSTMDSWFNTATSLQVDKRKIIVNCFLCGKFSSNNTSMKSSGWKINLEFYYRAVMQIFE